MKRSDIAFLVPYILLALAVGVSAYNVWSTLTFSVLPPGDLAPFGLMGLKAFSKGSINALSYGASAFLPAMLYMLGADAFHAFGVVTAAMFTLISLSVAYASLIITRSRIAMFIAGLLAAFLPLLSQPALTGDYPILAAAAFVLLAFSSSLSFLVKPRRSLLALLLLSCTLALLSDGSAAPVLVCPLILLVIMSWKEHDADRLRGFLAASVLTLGLGVFLTPFNVGGYASIIRNNLFASGLYLIQVILILLGLAAAAGLVFLHLTFKRITVFFLGWLGPPLILTCIGDVYHLVYAVPMLLVACSCTVTKFPGMLRIVRDAEAFVLELKLERVIAAFILVLLASAEIFYYPSALQAYCTGNVLGEEELSSIKIAGEKLQGLVAEGQLLAAPSRVAGWLGAFSGLNVVAPITAEERWELDAFTSTAFRLMNPYMMVDEWQPFSSRRSPFIYSYDGRIYAFILHVDDGTNVMKIVESNITCHEDMHGLKLVNYSWIETSRDITLILQLWKRGFNVTKTISLLKNEAELSISYRVVPNKGVELVNMTLPVYVEGRQKISSLQGDYWIQLDMPHVKVKFTYEGASTQPTLAYSNVQDYVTAVFTAKNNIIEACLRITLLNPKRSQEQARFTSFFETVKKWPVNFLMTYAAPEELLFLEDALEKPVDALEIIDSFNRVLLNHEGVNYVEAPSDAEVLSESSDGQNLTVTYKTAGLIIRKKVNVAQDAVDLCFEVAPWKNKTKLISMTVSLWLPWTRTVFMQENVSGGLRLVTDAGNFTIKAVKGNVTFLSLSPDPEFRQPRVQIQFSLNPVGDAIEVAVISEGDIQVEHVLSTRPMMNGSDRLIIRSLYMGLFRCLYRDQTFALYKIVPP